MHRDKVINCLLKITQSLTVNNLRCMIYWSLLKMLDHPVLGEQEQTGCSNAMVIQKH